MPLKRARIHSFLDLTPVSSDTTALSKSYFKLRLKIVRVFLRKRLFFKSQEVAATGYYGIEDPLPVINSTLRRFWWSCEVPVVGCQEPLVVRMA